MNTMKPYDPQVLKDFTHAKGEAGGPSPVFTSLVGKLAARKSVKNPQGLAAFAGKQKQQRMGGMK